MKFFTIAFTLLGTAASISASSHFQARQAFGFPTCALTCISNAQLGDCSPNDNACLCNNKPFINSTTTCIEATCTGADITNAEQLAREICAAVGVHLGSSAMGIVTTDPESST